MKNLLPPHEPQNLQALDALSDSVYSKLKVHLMDIKKLLNIDEASTAMLSWMAFTSQVDEWQNDWDDATKKRVINEQSKVHQKKGTVQAVQNALAGILGKPVNVVEVYRLFGENFGAYTFDVVIEGQKNLTAEKRKQVEKAVQKTAPVRSKMNGLFYRHPYADGTLKYDGTHSYDGGAIA